MNRRDLLKALAATGVAWRWLRPSEYAALALTGMTIKALAVEKRA